MQTPLWGRLCDRFGRRGMQAFTVGVFGIFSAACALSTTIEMLIVFRAFQGIGGGGILAVTMILLADLTPASKRAAYIAPVASMFALAAVCGPLLGGFLTDGPGWRYAFWINVPICVVVVIMVLIIVPAGIGQSHTAAGKRLALLQRRAAAVAAAASATAAASGASASAPSVGSSTVASLPPIATLPQQSWARRYLLCGLHTKAEKEAEAKADPELAAIVDESLDFLGTFVIIVAVILLCLALVWGGATYPWNSGTIIALLTVGIALLFVFVGVEIRFAEHPIVPMRLFRVRNFSVGSILSFLTGMTVTGGYVYLPIFFEVIMEKSASGAGIQMIPMMFGLPFGAIIAGAIVSKTGRYRWGPPTGAVMMIIASYLYTTLRHDTSTANQVGFLILGGLGMGPLVQIPLLAAQNAVELADQAVCSSTIQFFQSIGGLLSTAVMQSVLNNNVKEEITPVVAKMMPALYNATEEQIPFSADTVNLQKLQQYFPAYYPEFIDAYAKGVTSVFWVGLGSAAVALVASLFMQHVPLKEGIDAMAMHVEGAGPIIDGPAEVEMAKANIEKQAEAEESSKAAKAAVAGAVAVAVAGSKPAAAAAGSSTEDKDVTASPIVAAAEEPAAAAAMPEPAAVAVVAGAAPAVAANPTVV